MTVMRTPDACFEHLKDYRFSPNYLSLDHSPNESLRLHYLDEGSPTAAPILLLHGEPTWSYLYRHMIPQLVAAGHRVVAPDLIGFGKSDKPAERAAYSYQSHVDWLSAALVQLDLTDITLFCQDWGGLLGLRVLADMPERFARLVLSNTALPTGDHPMNAAFHSWRDFSQQVEPFNAGRIVHGGTATKLDADETEAYNAPFPDARFQAGARQFPMLVPDRPDDPASEANRRAWAVLKHLSLPVVTGFGAEDKVMAGIDRVFQTQMPGAAGQPHVVFPEAGHFLQEDVPNELVELILGHIARG